MIDYLELHVPNPDIDLLQAKLPVVSINSQDESRTYKSAKGQYGNLRVVGTSGVLIIKGSIHKYFNELCSGERENISRLHFHGLLSTLDHVSNDLGFKLKDAQIKTIEVGFNLQMDKNPVEYLQRIGTYVGHNGISYKMSRIIYNNVPFMIYGSGQGIVRKVYDKCSDVHIDKSILTKSKNLLRIELRIKKYAQIPSFPQSAEDLISLEHLKSLSNLVKEFASQLTVSRKLDIEYLWGNHSPNKIIKHLLLGYKDFMEISETIQNSYLPAKQKRLTINTLRKYMEHYPCPKLEGDEGVKVEIQSALEKEIEIFFTNV